MADVTSTQTFGEVHQAGYKLDRLLDLDPPPPVEHWVKICTEVEAALHELQLRLGSRRMRRPGAGS